MALLVTTAVLLRNGFTYACGRSGFTHACGHSGFTYACDRSVIGCAP
jgi:hypothetical protein